MVRLLLILTVFFITNFKAIGQNEKVYEIDFTDPESVVNAIFYAAQTKDFAILQCLCDPYEQGDGDTKGLCSIPNVEKSNEYFDDSMMTKNNLEQLFVQMFESGKINNKVTYEAYEGKDYAKVPFYFNVPNEQKSINETMMLVNRYGNWYLYSF